MSQDSPPDIKSDRVIHNGQIISPVPGVGTEELPSISLPSPAKPVPASVEDVDPEALAGLMARVISEAFNETPAPSPMEVVTRLLQLKTERGHKVVWTRFDVNQLFAIWSNKLDRTGFRR